MSTWAFGPYALVEGKLILIWPKLDPFADEKNTVPLWINLMATSANIRFKQGRGVTALKNSPCTAGCAAIFWKSATPISSDGEKQKWVKEVKNPRAEKEEQGAK